MTTDAATGRHPRRRREAPAGARRSRRRPAPRRPVGRHRGARRRAEPGAGGAAHRLGQVGGLLRGDRPDARARCRADGDHLAAAGADAQPDRGGRARRHPRGDDQLHQPRGLVRDPRAGRRRRDRRAAGQPRAAEQPHLPRRGAPPADRDGRPAGHRRGALHLRLGPRLPARLPADPPDDRHPAARHPGARDHRDRQRQGHRRRRRAAGDRRRHRRCSCCAARSTGSRCTSPCSSCDRPEQRLAWLGEHLGELEGCGIIYTLTVAATQEVAEHLRAQGHAVAAYSGQTEATERLALEQDLLVGSAQGAGRDQRPRHGLRRPPRFRGQPRRPRRHRSPTTSRSAVPAAAPARPR